MNHATKIFLDIILRENQTNKETSDRLFDFGEKKNNRTRKAIFCLRIITAGYMEEKRDIYAFFIYCTKAFDRFS